MSVDHRLGIYFSATLDGQPVERCIAADSGEGWVDVYDAPETFVHQVLATRRLFGRVELRLGFTDSAGNAVTMVQERT